MKIVDKTASGQKILYRQVAQLLAAPKIHIESAESHSRESSLVVFDLRLKQKIPIRICEINFVDSGKLTPHLLDSKIIVVQDQLYSFAASVGETKNTAIDIIIKIGIRSIARGISL